MTFWEWLNTPFKELPWYHGVFVGMGGGLIMGFVIGLGIGWMLL
jgi:hypothetical protein